MTESIPDSTRNNWMHTVTVQLSGASPELQGRLRQLVSERRWEMPSVGRILDDLVDLLWTTISGEDFCPGSLDLWVDAALGRVIVRIKMC